MKQRRHDHTHVEELYERRGITRATRRRLTRTGRGPANWWLRPLGVVVVAAALAALLLRLEPNAVDYAIASALIGSLGLLAFVSADRALSAGLRYEESVQYVEEAEESYRSLRQVFCTALDFRDHVTGGHSERVAETALELGRRLGLPDNRLAHLEWAALLHDIGKVRVAEGILVKPGPLDAEEWREMREHPYHSYTILSQVDSLMDAAEIVYCHHERFDGMGYPRRLKGAEIPIEARIFAVIDAYDAMVSNRPYRDPFSHDEALREIALHAGTQFDPQVVRAFLEVAGSAAQPVVGEPVRLAPPPRDFVIR